MSYKAFETLTAPARKFPQIWRLGLGMLAGFVFYVVAAMVYFAIAGFFATEQWIFEAVTGKASAPSQVFYLLGSFVFMAGGGLVAALLHKRRLPDLIGGYGRTLRSFVQSTIALLPLMILAIAYTIWVETLTPGLALGMWLMLLPFALILVFIQVSAEELIFRGYLQSQLAALNLHPILWVTIPAILFGLAHYDPTNMQDAAPWIVLWAFVFGLFAADLTARTGTLGPAIAMHFANNIIPFLIFGYPDYLSGLALYTLPYSAFDTEHLKAGLIVQGVFTLLMYLAVRLKLRV
ncbi:MAG: CPBP family intramembrane glutamic endopeptidase [Planktomarina sp.]